MNLVNSILISFFFIFLTAFSAKWSPYFVCAPRSTSFCWTFPTALHSPFSQLHIGWIWGTCILHFSCCLDPTITPSTKGCMSDIRSIAPAMCDARHQHEGVKILPRTQPRFLPQTLFFCAATFSPSLHSFSGKNVWKCLNGSYCHSSY